MTGKGTPDPQGWADGKIRTRETNPLYCGAYTIDDYNRDTDARLFKPETLEFQRFILAGISAVDPEEGERFDRLYGEALKAYDGPTEWEYGYKLNNITHCDYATCLAYYYHYYELTDADAITEIKGRLERNRDLVSFASRVHPLLLEAVKNSDLARILEETGRVTAELKEEPTENRNFEVPTAEQLTRSIIWTYLRVYLGSLKADGQDSTSENPPDPMLAAKECLRRELNFRKSILEAKKKNLEARNDALEMLGELEAEGYGPLIEHVRESYTEERAWKYKALNIEVYTLYIVAEYKGLIGSPPETITADTEAEIEEACRKVEENTNKPVTLTLEGQLEELTEIPTEERKILKDMGITGGQPDRLYVPINDFTAEARKKLSNVQMTFDPESGLFKRIAKEILIESDKNNDQEEWLRMNLILGNREPPSLTELGFIEQLGAEREAILKEGGSLKLTEIQLFRRRYGLDSDASIYPETRAEFKRRFEELSEIRVLIPAMSRSNLDTSKDGEYLETIYTVAEKVRLIEPKIEIAWTDKKKEKLIDVYTFENPIPIHHVNAWHGNIIRVNWDLIQTEKIPAEELSPKARRHYDEENLRGDKRKTDALSLDPIKSADLKYCILHSLIYAYGFTQKAPTVILNLEEAYKAIYGKPAPPKREREWKNYVRYVYTYLTFLIEKGCIEEYRKGKDSGRVLVDIGEGNKMLYPRA